MGPIWDQKGTPQKGGTVPVALCCPTLATSSAEGLQTSIFVGPPMQFSRFWVAKGTILEPIWDQKGTPQKGVIDQAPGVHGRFGFQLLNKALEPKKGLQTSIFVTPPLQLSRFWVAKGTILGPILDQNGTMKKSFLDSTGPGSRSSRSFWVPALEQSSGTQKRALEALKG